MPCSENPQVLAGPSDCGSLNTKAVGKKTKMTNDKTGPATKGVEVKLLAALDLGPDSPFKAEWSATEVRFQ